ncbi:MAG: hypothetical protein HQL73_07645 [Magnetococcales bacterium]|nr:hypothetical protein [Magnetococcales bacterium]
MQFIPLYYKKNLEIINPEGDVGVVTLWSPCGVVKKRLAQIDADLLNNNSRIAVLGTLYGDGLPELLRNLLYNPQIRYLVLFGVDLGKSRLSLTNFFSQGLELTTCLGSTVYQIIGTMQKMDGAIHPHMFAGRLTMMDLGAPNEDEALNHVDAFFKGLAPRVDIEIERIAIPLPQPVVTRYPSEPRSHTITATTPMEAWRELVFRLLRFGHRVHLNQGKERIELQTVKVTIAKPEEESSEVLQEHGFSLEEFREYQRRMLNPHLPPDQRYSYGHRLGQYFHGDTLEHAMVMLRENSESRHVYISLWDTGGDYLMPVRGHPCLVSLYFRRFEERLTLTAVFRTHNALRAWPENVYGLMALQRHVCDKVHQAPGPLIVFSHSISIDPQGGGLERAEALCQFRRRQRSADDFFIPDAHGDFFISVDMEKKQIIVDHRFEGQRLHRYIGRSAEELERQLVVDHAVSDVAHALYLGRELGRAEARLIKVQRRSG